MSTKSGLLRRFLYAVISMATICVFAAPAAATGEGFNSVIRPGFNAGTGTADYNINLLSPVYQTGSSLLFFNPNFRLNPGQDDNEFNVGLGYRQLIMNDDWYVGANVYYDTIRSGNANRYHQIGVGVEARSKWIDVLLNGHIPVGENKNRLESGDLFRLGTRSLLRAEGMEEQLGGIDGEVGVLVPYISDLMETRAYIGGYWWSSELGSDIGGVKGRIEIMPVPLVTVNGSYSYDDTFNSVWRGEAYLNVPFSFTNIFEGKNPFEGISDYVKWGGGARGARERMTDRVERDRYIMVLENSGGTDGYTTFNDMIYVDNSNVDDPDEDGTLDHPYDTIDEALNDPLYLAEDGAERAFIYIFQGLSGNGDGEYENYPGEYWLLPDSTIWGEHYALPGMVAGGFPVIDGDYNYWFGLMLTGGDNVIRGLQIQNMDGSAIVCEEGGLTGAEIYDNYLTNNWGWGIELYLLGSGGYDYESMQSGPQGQAEPLDNAVYAYIHDNEISYNEYGGVYVYNDADYADVKIFDNDELFYEELEEGQAGMAPMVVEDPDTPNGGIHGNGTGIYVENNYGEMDLDVSCNNILDNWGYNTGIHIFQNDGTMNAEIVGNNILWNSGDGIYLSIDNDYDVSTLNANIVDNVIMYNNGNGISAGNFNEGESYAATMNITTQNNDIEYNYGDGMFFRIHSEGGVTINAELHGDTISNNYGMEYWYPFASYPGDNFYGWDNPEWVGSGNGISIFNQTCCDEAHMNVKAYNCTIENNNYAGINAENSDQDDYLCVMDILVDGGSVSGNGSDGISLYDWGYWGNSLTATVQNATVDENGGSGIYLENGYGYWDWWWGYYYYAGNSTLNVLDNISISGNSGAGVAGYNQAGEMTLNVSGNQAIDWNEVGGVLVLNRDYDSYSHLTVDGNESISFNGDGESGGIGIYSFHAGGMELEITDNANISNNFGDGIYINNHATMMDGDNVISGNTISGNDNNGILVESYYSHLNLTVSGNDITGNGGHGISLQNDDGGYMDVDMTDNVISGNSEGIGIWNYYADMIAFVSGNAIFDNSGFGLYLDSYSGTLEAVLGYVGEVNEPGNNSIVGNYEGGIYNGTGDTVWAEGNYWGGDPDVSGDPVESGGALDAPIPAHDGLF